MSDSRSRVISGVVMVLIERGDTRILPIHHSAPQRPHKRQICDEQRRRALADIPVRPHGAEGLREGVDFIQTGGEDDEDAEGEDEHERDFAADGEAHAQEHGEADEEHDDVRTEIEGCVGDEVVGCGVALHAVGGDGPVL